MTSLVPLPLPDLDGDWSAWLTERSETTLARAAELRAELVGGAADPLEVWNGSASRSPTACTPRT